MRKTILLTILLFLIAITSFSQKASVSGSVKDTIEHKGLELTLVTLMKNNDSLLAGFTRVDKDNHFKITGLDTGRYIIMITHPLLGDYFDNFHLGTADTKDIGTVYMTPKSKLLAEVIVRTGSPIRIKGDTTVYTADSFKVRAGANVEELLRRLPGIQVDKDGKITAMGERVTKMLVDGEEFFGTDPGIASKNLRADVVKEVEVFDKKSDQATFTGIDDGVKDKTINLKLKDDKKNGYFGKVELGGGTDNRFNNDIMANAFKGKRKLAGYGIMSNSGQTNLDWDDARNYGGGDGIVTEMSDDGGMMIMYGGGDGEDGYWGGRNGIPINWNGGLHFSDKYDLYKMSINGGYKFSKVNSPGLTRIFSKNFFPDTSWNTNSVNNTFSSPIKHSLNFTAEMQLDSNNSFKWTSGFNTRKTRTSNDFISESFADNGNFINKNHRQTNGLAENDAFNTNLLWRHKFKKLSRTLSVNSSFNINKSATNSLLQSRIDYYDNGTFDRYDSIDQRQKIESDGLGFTTKATYTEPLVKDLYMELSYALSINSNTNDRDIRSKNGNGKYEEMVDSLSNAYTFNRLVNTPGVSIKGTKKKYSYTIGASMGFSQFTQKDKTLDKEYGYSFTNFFPRATFSYKLKGNTNLRFNYEGSTTAPTLEQMQPIKINTDPLNIYIGNPDLKQSFRHNFGLGYNFYNVLEERGFWSSLRYSLTSNAFSQFSSVDSGIRTYQTVNVDGQQNLSFYSDYNFTLKESKIRLGFGPNINFTQNVDYVRSGSSGVSVKNITKNTSYMINMNVNKYKENKYNFYFGPSFGINKSTATVSTGANATYWRMSGWANGQITIKDKIDLGSDLNYQVQEKDPRFPANTSYMIWNIHITKRFFKNNDFELKLGVYDVLNQNRGYDRNFSSYNFTETYYTTLKRFGMLTATWNFSKNGAGPKKGFF